MLKKISDLYSKSKEQTNVKRLVLASAADEHSLDAIFAAKKEKIIEPILVGDKNLIHKICNNKGYDLTNVELIDIKDNKEAVKISVQLVRNKKADIIMKGNVPTATLLRAVLNDEYGLKTGKLLSHFALFELKNYHKLIGLTDVAMNIAPNLKEKAGIISNSVNYMNRIGYTNPKVAVIAAVEVVNEKMPATIDDPAILSEIKEDLKKHKILK